MNTYIKCIHKFKCIIIIIIIIVVVITYRFMCI